MGLAGYVSGKPSKSTGQRYDDIARRDIFTLGYQAAKTKWENPSTIKDKEASGRFGQYYLEQAPDILRHLESVNAENMRNAPSPTPIPLDAEVLGKQAAKKRQARRTLGRQGTILTGGLGGGGGTLLGGSA